MFFETSPAIGLDKEGVLPPPTKSPRQRPEHDLEDLIVDLRRDADEDPVHYLLRSNTNHDGE
ncbi:MAG: hypothetical protein AAFU85_03495 [Planctomycetota bacterium]